MTPHKAESILFRFKPFSNKDFIDEHNAVLKKYGKVWVWKVGKPIPTHTVRAVIENDGGLILKSPKKDGDRYYYCHLIDYIQEKPTDSHLYPKYYEQIQVSEFEPWDSESWFCIDSLDEVTPQEVEQLCLCSNNRKVVDVIKETRTVIMRVYKLEN